MESIFSVTMELCKSSTSNCDQRWISTTSNHDKKLWLCSEQESPRRAFSTQRSSCQLSSRWKSCCEDHSPTSAFRTSDRELCKLDLVAASLEKEARLLGEEAQILEEEARGIKQVCLGKKSESLEEERKDLERARLDLDQNIGHYYEQRNQEYHPLKDRENKAMKTERQRMSEWYEMRRSNKK